METQDVVQKLKIQFDNGVTLRASFAQIAQSIVAVSVYATDAEGVSLHTVRRNITDVEGFIAVVNVLNEVKAHLLACDVNKFKGKPGMAVVQGILTSYDKAFYKDRAAV